jgi:NAD(P)-dependent dehydrogenase (short-subunit alcohol dehydrogenase family)
MEEIATLEAQVSVADVLRDRVAIVSGAGSVGRGIGNGRAVAMIFAAAGAALVLVDKDVEAAQETAAYLAPHCAKYGTVAVVVEGDASEQADAAAAVQRCQAEFGRLDVLVNNVGIIGPPGTAVDVNPDTWDRAMRINVKSAVLMSKYAIPLMLASAGRGSIINVASVSGLLGGHPNLFYPTSKGAIIALTRAMAAHHGRDGVRVNCIAPGMVYTPMVESRGMDAAMRERRRRANPLETEGNAWDVAMAALFLAGEQARWVTGVVLPVDGGASAVHMDKPSPE